MTSRRFRQARRDGMTLIEIMLVLVILVIVSSIAVGMFTNTQKKAQIKAASAQIGSFETPIGTYYLDTNQYPPSLEALRVAPSNLSNPAKWAGPYMSKDIPLDPWGNPYQYVVPGAHRPEAYDIWSLGPDGVDGSEDDIGNWE